MKCEASQTVYVELLELCGGFHRRCTRHFKEDLQERSPRSKHMMRKNEDDSRFSSKCFG